MGALMKYWQDPEMLAKLGDKLGDIAPAAGAAAAANASAAPDAANEVSDLLSACRCAFLYIFFFNVCTASWHSLCTHLFSVHSMYSPSGRRVPCACAEQQVGCVRLVLAWLHVFICADMRIAICSQRPPWHAGAALWLHATQASAAILSTDLTSNCTTHARLSCQSCAPSR